MDFKGGNGMGRWLGEGLGGVLTVARLGGGGASGPSSLEAAKVTRPQVIATSGHITSKSNSSKSKAYQVGTASWYGEQFQGKQTASGEPFDMQDFTAAHPTLKLGTFVKVTNLRNGSSVVVRINYRAPLADARFTYLSYNAAPAPRFHDPHLQPLHLHLVPPT